MGNNISGVILAGGSSKRFHGITKAKIEINGKSVISRIVETVRDLFNEIIIVTNSPDEFKEFFNYKLVGDHFLNFGPLGGIHAAIKAASNEAVFVFAGDMPFLDREIIIKQIQLYNESECDLLIPRIDGNIEPLHTIYNTSIENVLEDYLERDRDRAVRAFFKLMRVKYFLLESSKENETAFFNINSPSDISIVEKIIGK